MKSKRRQSRRLCEIELKNSIKDSKNFFKHFTKKKRQKGKTSQKNGEEKKKSKEQRTKPFTSTQIVDARIGDRDR